MPSDEDWCYALRDLVDSVYDYTDHDPDWEHAHTPQAHRGRAEMEAAAQKIAIALLGRSLSRQELAVVFTWEYD